MVDDVIVHFQNYEFGDSVVTSNDLTMKMEANASDLMEVVTLFRDQEPLRTLAWMAG
jgi:hypothetical protein